MEVFIEYLDTTKQSWWEAQWILTILGAIIPILLTLFMNFKQEKRNEKFNKEIANSNNEFQKNMVQMQIDADITARARIEWIQNTRNITVDFMNSCYSLINFMDIIRIGESKPEIPMGEAIAAASVSISKNVSEKSKAYGNDKKNIFEEQVNVQRYGTLLTLYFGPDNAKENEFIVYLIEDIIKKLTTNKVLFEADDLMITKMIGDLKNALRAYYKVEWKRASGRYEDDEVNEALNSEVLYRYVKDKYEAPFINNSDPSKEKVEYELIDNIYVEIT